MKPPLWAPWRMSWILGEKPTGCIFCEYAAGAPSLETLTLHVSRHAFVVLNRFPYTNGHVMVVPRTHAGRIVDLSDEEYLETARLVRVTAQVLHETLAPQGINIGMNQGEAAGAGIAAHLHWHLVPRWVGDTSFLSAVGDTRVISQALEETWRLMRGPFEAYEAARETADGAANERGAEPDTHIAAADAAPAPPAPADDDDDDDDENGARKEGTT